ncbi:hypothetical protein BSL78_22440 [Apostichopus japonicus]|uniref:Uncharacterized protein n=1 Tax=Stichopus japonicus TaxID=307972 RepID=A0A2G8JY86_STIJA|nr:hypothetical protein BSL78_22440 [Apostichopus japonicus]
MKYVFVLTVAVTMALFSHAYSSPGPSEFSAKDCAECSVHCEIPAVRGKGSLTCVAESPSVTNINCTVMDPKNIYVTSLTSSPRSEGPGMGRLRILYELTHNSKKGSFHCMFADPTGASKECTITAVYKS